MFKKSLSGQNILRGDFIDFDNYILDSLLNMHNKFTKQVTSLLAVSSGIL